MSFTSQVLPEHLQASARLRHTAHYFQEAIAKDFELRITVVGKRVFAAAIYSQHAQEARIDFRQAYGELRYAIYQLPPAIEEACRRVVQAYGLAYGAIDMAVTPTGAYIFFEINGAGQYHWIEQETGLPITEALVELLVKGDNGSD